MGINDELRLPCDRFVRNTRAPAPHLAGSAVQHCTLYRWYLNSYTIIYIAAPVRLT